MVQKSLSVVLLFFPPLSKIVVCSRDGALCHYYLNSAAVVTHCKVF